MHNPNPIQTSPTYHPTKLVQTRNWNWKS